MSIDNNQMHYFIKQNRDVLVERNKRRMNRLALLRELQAKSVDELIESSYSEEWHVAAKRGSFDEYLPLVEILLSRLGDHQDSEFADILNYKKSVWECKPDRFVALIKRIGMGLDEAIQRIKDQMIEGGELTMTMARSAQTRNHEMREALEDFSLQIEIDKREKFIHELQKY